MNKAFYPGWRMGLGGWCMAWSALLGGSGRDLHGARTSAGPDPDAPENKGGAGGF